MRKVPYTATGSTPYGAVAYLLVAEINEITLMHMRIDTHSRSVSGPKTLINRQFALHLDKPGPYLGLLNPHLLLRLQKKVHVRPHNGGRSLGYG